MSDREQELRDALQAKAGAMRPGRADEQGLLRRMSAARRRRRQARLAGVAAAVVLAVGAASLVAADDPDRETVVAGPDPSSTTTFLEPTTTTPAAPEIVVPSLPTPGTGTVAPEATLPPAPATTAAPARVTTTTAPLPPVPEDAVWPAPGSATTFSAPDRATNDFARRFLGMATPQVGPARVTGDTAAVDLRALPTAGSTTVVSLRRIDRRGWVVVGAAAPTIQVSSPAAGAKVASPLTVRGQAWTFEGHVAVEVRRDGAAAPIGRSFGTGGGDQLRPFEATVTFARPSAARGTLVALEPRADDDSQGPLAATVVRVTF